MSKQEIRSPKTWIIVHVYFPLFPAVLEIMIRLGVIHFDWTWGTFWDICSGPTLAMSCGLVCLFIYQSLISTSIPLSNRTKEEERKQWAMIFIMGAIVFFAFFGLIMQIELFATYHNNPAAKTNMSFYKSLLFILALITIRVSHRIPHNFNLEATL